MTSSKRDIESIRSLIPLYAKGLLSDSEKAEVEKSLVEYPDLKDEIKRWERIGEAYKVIEEQLPQAPAGLYTRITGKIAETTHNGLLEKLTPSPRLSLALVFAQLLIIVALGVYVINLKNEYRTLTAPSETVEKPVRINLLFKENAQETEIRNLLLKIDAQIIDGPYSSGLYVIGISSEERLAAALDILKGSRIVVMAERVH